MRDLMMLGGMIVLIPLAIADSLAAYLLWGWTAVLSPVYYLYGFMQDVRYNLTFAVIALVLLFVKRRNAVPFKPNRTFVLILALSLHTMLCIVFGYPSNPFNQVLGEQFFKSMLFCLVMFWFVRDRQDMHAILVMLGLGLGFHGVVEGMKVIVTGGGHHVGGIRTSMMSDNNHFGVAMVIVIPLLYYLQQYSKNRLARIGFFSGLLLTVVSVLGTHSRGGMIALCVVGLWFFVTSQRKFRAAFVIALSVAAVLFIAPDSWFDRMDSIADAGQDSSFMGRVAAWKISSAIAMENPIFGGGINALRVQHVWEKFRYAQGFMGFIYTPEPDLRAKAAHSIYFETLGDRGVVGLLLFVSVFVSAIGARYQIKALIKDREVQFGWALDMANALMLSIIAYLVGGAAVSLAYFELPFMLAMLMELLRQHTSREVSSVAKLPKNWG